MNIPELVQDIYQNSMGLTPIAGYESLGTEAMNVIAAYIGDKPESTAYGRMLVFFVYKNETYKLMFNVHQPLQGTPVLSNRPLNLETIELRETHGIEYLNKNETGMGCRAFWMNTPDSCLDGDDLELRRLINNLKRYSRENRLCEKIRKMDRKALKVNPLYREE